MEFDKSLLKSQCFIQNNWINSEEDKTIEVINPATNELIGTIPHLSENQINQAITAAYTALDSWKNISATERTSFLKKWLQLIEKHAHDIACIIVLEQGKPYTEALGEVHYAASYIEYYQEEIKRISGDILPSPFPDSRVFVIKQAIGVVGIISPWNFPIAMMVRKLAPALAAGCTCVIKPDEKTPLSALAIIALAEEAGIPSGVINVITGNPSEIGKLLCESSLVRKISFTGSTRVGKILMQQSADTVKKLSLELGGNAPFIVFEDADLDKAVEGLILAKFRNGGQTCVCANRIFVHASILDAFTEKLHAKVKALKVGNGFDKSDIGPLINQQAMDKIQHLIADACSKGAKVSVGGKVHQLGGNFFEPTILSQVDKSMQIFNDEIFGPIASLISFTETEEVIAMANDTKQGLASYFYSNDMSKIWKVAEALEYGMVGINRGAISSAWIPFGGVKESGMGREGSKYGIEEYLETKYICLGE